MIEFTIAINNKHFGDDSSIAIKKLEFSVKAGEFIAIVGPSGCGKTTLLNMIADLEDASQQSICTPKNPEKKLIEQTKVAYIFQQPRLMPWLTVRENIALVLSDDDSLRIDDLLAQVGLAGKGELFPKQLSGGMQRRVSIARAFAVKPELLLLDEPFASLDAPTASQLQQLLLSLCQQYGTTVLFVTHNLQEAIFLADRILFLSASPSSIIYQASVPIAKPRQEFGEQELAWQAKLLAQYPSLLSGQL